MNRPRVRMHKRLARQRRILDIDRTSIRADERVTLNTIDCNGAGIALYMYITGLRNGNIQVDSSKITRRERTPSLGIPDLYPDLVPLLSRIEWVGWAAGE